MTLFRIFAQLESQDLEATMDKDILPAGNSETDSSPADVEVAVDTVSGRRRRLIKASAAAVPAVMTLRSGAAAAMVSTYDCTKRDNTLALEGVDQILEASDGVLVHDHWLRVPGKKVLANPPGGGNATTIVYCVETGSGGSPSSPTWQCFNEDGTDYAGNLSASAIDRGDNVALLAYLNFDEYGNDSGEPALFYPVIQTVQPAPPGYSPLTGSCLSSIHPNLNILG